MSLVTGIPLDMEFPYHRQDTSNNCGAACVQMILDHHGKYLPHFLLSHPDPEKSPKQLIEQSDLINTGKSLVDPIKDPESASWIVSPSELVKILEKYGVAGYESLGWGKTSRIGMVNDIYHFTTACQDAVGGMSGELYCPPMIVVDGIHWIILTSCISDPTGILGFYYHDPLSFSSGTPVPPLHFRGDSCSYHGVNGNAHIPFKAFIGRTIARKIIVRWKDGSSAIDRGKTKAHDISRIKRLLKKKIAPYPISEEEIAAKVSSAIEEHGLTTRKGWDQLLSRTSIGLPLKVRQGQQNSLYYYYLAPVQNQTGETKMLVLMDAATGDYDGSLKVASGHFLFRDNPKVRDLVDKALVELRSKLSQDGILDTSSWETEFKNQVNSTRPNLMWFPCRESESSFFPFYAIQPANSRAVYVRIDGEVFISLTSN